MTAKYTPGPWRVESDTDICSAAGEFVATAHFPESTVGTAREYGNAALIAAAPELLEACTIALALVRDTWIADHGSESVGRAWGALDAAIRKATGG
jgi:hypothetical protein